MGFVFGHENLQRNRLNFALGGENENMKKKKYPKKDATIPFLHSTLPKDEKYKKFIKNTIFPFYLAKVPWDPGAEILPT